MNGKIDLMITYRTFSYPKTYHPKKVITVLFTGWHRKFSMFPWGPKRGDLRMWRKS
jgi:hypothetical protein